MAVDPPDVLAPHMNRAIATFNKHLDELRILMGNFMTTRSDATKMLAKVKAVHDTAITTCTPVIDCYEKLNTADAKDKVDKAEEARDNVKLRSSTSLAT